MQVLFSIQYEPIEGLVSYVVASIFNAFDWFSTGVGDVNTVQNS